VTRPGPWQIVQGGKGLAAAQTGQIRDAGEASLVEQLAAVPQALGYGARLGECAAGDEERSDVECGLADAPARVVTGQLVVGDELLAHVQQHVVELRWILCDRRGHLGHALPGVGIGQRHQTRHGADHAIDQTELDVGVERDAVGEGVSEFITEDGDQGLAYPLLEHIQCVAEGFGEVGE
jgi:hypothetical protein